MARDVSATSIDAAGGGGAPRVRIDRLGKVFETGKTATVAVQDFSLDIADGEFVCIVGPSGCGKTTVLRIVAGLDRQSSGTLLVRRSAAAAQPLNAMVFQEHGLFPWLTVADNVAYGLEMRGIGKRERLQRIGPFLDMIGLAGFRDHYPGQLSGGMKQRVSIARAFVNDPEILLMDEPFAALDAQNKIIMQEELLRIWERNRKTVIFITHAIDEAITMGDRVVVMTANPGRIKDIVPIAFPRPRNVAELKADPEFGRLSLAIWKLLEDEVRRQRLQG
ncbi:MAG: Taurine-transporting ATPase [Rhodospirillales bacterium]|nr:Taurine-transporting ATPase [Rhodospirillales bacterium]